MFFAYIQTIVVYLGLAILMFTGAKKYERTGKWKHVLIPVIVYAIIFGMRYFVGSDSLHYVRIYEGFVQGKYNLDFGGRWELGFLWYTILMSSLHVPSWIYMGIISFVQLYLVVYAFRNNRKLIPWILWVFMIGGYWLTYANGLRQMIAVSLWILSLKYIANKDIKRHYCCLIIAFFFHKASVILLPFYFLCNWKKVWFKNRIVELALLAASLVLMMTPILQDMLKSIDRIAITLGYGDYLTDFDQKDIIEGASIGIGFLINLMINIIIIYNSEGIKKHFNNRLYNIVYDFFFVGAFLRNVLLNSLLFSRLNYYFDNMSWIMGAIALLYAKQRGYQTMYYSLICLYGLVFLAFIYKAEVNSALFIFEWQKDLYYLKDVLF